METLFTMRHSVEQYGHNSVLNVKEDHTVSREKYKNIQQFVRMSHTREKYHNGLT